MTWFYFSNPNLGADLSAEGLARSPSKDIGSEETLVATEDDTNSCGVCSRFFAH